LAFGYGRYGNYRWQGLFYNFDCFFFWSNHGVIIQKITRFVLLFLMALAPCPGSAKPALGVSQGCIKRAFLLDIVSILLPFML